LWCNPNQGVKLKIAKTSGSRQGKENEKEEELAILEVIYAICDFKGINRKELELLREKAGLKIE